MQQEIDESTSKYVLRKRFISMIDKRGDNDIIYMYNPPKSVYTSDIPDPQPALWGISSSKTCILPPMEYDENVAIGLPSNRDSADDSRKNFDETKDKNIEASFRAKGNLLTFSFQIKSLNERKCYLWWNGQCIRLFPNEVGTVFSEIFNMDHGNNKEYLKSKDITDTLVNMKQGIYDKAFDLFVLSCKNF